MDAGQSLDSQKCRGTVKTKRQGLAQGPLTTCPLADTPSGLSLRPVGNAGHPSLGFRTHFYTIHFTGSILGSATSAISVLPHPQKGLS